jgi:hypothetical protein
MITLRLDPQTELLLKSAAEHLGLSRTELIRQSILDYLSRNNAPSAWETGKHLFGKYSSGCGDLSARRKELVKEKIRAKRA